MADPTSTDIINQNEIETKTEPPQTQDIVDKPNEPDSHETTPVIEVSKEEEEVKSNSNGETSDSQPTQNNTKVGPTKEIQSEDCGFQITSSLMRKTYNYKDNARKERTGRKLTFVDEVSDTEPLTITRYSDTLHYAPLLRSEHNRGSGFVEVKNSGGCCLIS